MMKKYFKLNKQLKIGLALLFFLITILVISFVYTPYDVTILDSTSILQSPNLTHPFGTDEYGRDLLSLTMLGTKQMFIVAFGSTIIAVVIGVPLGLFTGYKGGTFDNIVMRVIDGFMAIPTILILLILVSTVASGTIGLVFAIGITTFPSYVRMVRAKIFEVKNTQMVLNAKSKGISNFSQVAKYMLPLVGNLLIVSVALSLSTAVLIEASLSYLGFVNSAVPSWGQILRLGQDYITTYPFYSFVPATMIFISVLTFNLIADGVKQMMGVDYVRNR